MDPVTVGAVLLAIASGAGEALGASCGRAWLPGPPSFHCNDGAGGDAAGAAAMMSAGTAELAARQQAPGDQERAVALAEALLTPSGADPEFRQVLESWWVWAGPVRASAGTVTTTISGGTQHGPVLQGRDFSNITFSASPPGSPS